MREGVLSYYYIREVYKDGVLLNAKFIQSSFIPPMGATLSTDHGDATVSKILFIEKPMLLQGRIPSNETTAEVIVIADLI